MKLGKGVNELSFWCFDTPQRNRNNLPDLLRTMPVKVFIKDGKISNDLMIDDGKEVGEIW